MLVLAREIGDRRLPLRRNLMVIISEVEAFLTLICISGDETIVALIWPGKRSIPVPFTFTFIL